MTSKHTLLPLLGVLLSAAIAQGQLINIDLGNSTTVGSDQSAGVVASTGWQQKSGYPNFSNQSLLFSDGSPSNGLITAVNGTGNYSSIGASTTDPNYTMFNRDIGISGNTGLTTITVTSLTNTEFSGGYDVYVYIAANANSSSHEEATISLSDGTSTYYVLVNETIASYQGSFIQSTATSSGTAPIANYVKFSGLTGDSFTISSQNVDDLTGAVAGLAGMQIVAVPEPSTMAYLGMLTVLSFLYLVKRRR